MTLVQNALKYLIEGFAVGLAAYMLRPYGRRDMKAIVVLGLTASVTFFVMDVLAPNIAQRVRMGAGFRLGFKMSGGAQKKEKVLDIRDYLAALQITREDRIDTKIRQRVKKQLRKLNEALDINQFKDQSERLAEEIQEKLAKVFE